MKTGIITFLLIMAITTTGLAQTNDTMKTFDPAFAHTVYFWFKNPDNKSDMERFEASLTTFLKNSKFAKTNFVGKPPEATRDVVDGSFTYSLIVTFESAKAQEGYQNEEAHLIFIEECKDLWEKVIVYDSFGIKQ
ncbi:Dabb family protein [Flagellimonas pacifica]|uniref:Stress responsive A/B Barrel Domain n=1 Tax=Flagellimonas pacifica TaxID=1247520 RepID=A0A285MZQ3_9FLAO|nr:Dabb family protein [Allomuricauda parva]SNZ01256.1 Stress responsive A/B Barrel Domain [Allomuricauda parva]